MQCAAKIALFDKGDLVVYNAPRLEYPCNGGIEVGMCNFVFSKVAKRYKETFVEDL